MLAGDEVSAMHRNRLNLHQSIAMSRPSQYRGMSSEKLQSCFLAKDDFEQWWRISQSMTQILRIKQESQLQSFLPANIIWAQMAALHGCHRSSLVQITAMQRTSRPPLILILIWPQLHMSLQMSGHQALPIGHT